MQEKFDSKLPVIAIVGRPNVGKSSLFNAIAGRRLSIVHEMPGVTRDRVSVPVRRHGVDFQLIDTGGLAMLTRQSRNIDVWDSHIAAQVEVAIEGADLLILVANVQEGVVVLDREVAGRIRSIGKPVLVVANKCDNPELVQEAALFSELGFESLFPVSCTHRYGIDTLMDRALSLLPAAECDAGANRDGAGPARQPIRLAVVGRPNVGKSSLVNALLGEDRVITSDVAGTTRDAIDIDFSIDWHGEKMPAVLIDTAGLRRKGKVLDAVELFSAMRVEEAIKRADLVLFVTEAAEHGFTAQDRRIGAMIEAAGKGCVVVANKYDLSCDEFKQKALLAEFRYTLPSLSYAPVVFASALKRQNLNAVLDAVTEVMEQLDVKVPTGVLNRVLSDAFERLSPPVVGLNPLKLYYANMVGTRPPKFLLFVNHPDNCAPNYLSYLRNALRAAFDYTGFPILVEVRARPKKVEGFHTSSPARNTRRKKK